MLISTLLRAARHQILIEGWWGGGHTPGRCCLVTSLSHVPDNNVEQWGEAYRYLYAAVFGAECETDVVDTARLVRWNDVPNRTLPEVMEAFGRAIARAEQDELLHLEELLKEHVNLAAMLQDYGITVTTSMGWEGGW